MLFIFRISKSEEEFKSRESTLQDDLENASFNESKLAEQCELFEKQYHAMRREKDEQYFELRQMTERACDLEKKMKAMEETKTELEVELNDLRNTLRGNMLGNNENEALFMSPSKGWYKFI